uniref:Uncharacterized protein n=1 Tax=Rhizophora mucronata TaxID=61149 RepID=A0A2P2NQP8_RHIMU
MLQGCNSGLVGIYFMYPVPGVRSIHSFLRFRSHC